ncbi:conserved hypothetical protein [Mesorhizobium delmotii]|uniref:Uncharacterized protein n=1 Tax=Mesorhizobium delmotii TaxID=1631247 RepID=A0A2P9AWU5_9HYPH|nr:conserved hypothetical protein [Mesorhizobium delmotii]
MAARPFRFACNGFPMVPDNARTGSVGMAVKRDRTRIEVRDTAVESETSAGSPAVAHAAILRLARLIGRQIAREQFEPRLTAERRTKAGTRSDDRP